MPKKTYDPGQEVDPNTLTGLSETQKQHYLSSGLKPFRMRSGRIKWLNPEQHHYKLMRSYGSRKFFRILRQYTGNRKRGSLVKVFLRFLLEHWIYVLLFIIIVLIFIKSEYIIDSIRNYL